MGFVYQRGNRLWISYSDKKTRKRVRKPEGSSRLEAQRALHRIDGTEFGTLFDDIAEIHLEALSVRTKKQSVAVAASSLRRLTEFFNGKEMTRLAISGVNAFIRSRQQDGVKPGTINGDLVTLRAALNFAVKARLLEKVPVKVKLLRAPRKRVLPILSPQDLKV